MPVNPYSVKAHNIQLGCNGLWELSTETSYFKYRFSSLLHHIPVFKNESPHPGNHSRPSFYAVSFPHNSYHLQKGDDFTGWSHGEQGPLSCALQPDSYCRLHLFLSKTNCFSIIRFWLCLPQQEPFP